MDEKNRNEWLIVLELGWRKWLTSCSLTRKREWLGGIEDSRLDELRCWFEARTEPYHGLRHKLGLKRLLMG